MRIKKKLRRAIANKKNCKSVTVMSAKQDTHGTKKEREGEREKGVSG